MPKKTRSKSKIDPTALRARFLRVGARKSLKHHAELSKIPATPPAAAAPLGILDWLWNQVRLYLWCRDVEQELDHGTQFLRDNWNQLSEDGRNGLEQDLSDLLDSYAESC